MGQTFKVFAAAGGIKERQSGRVCSQRGHRDPAGSGRLCIVFGFFRVRKLGRVLSRECMV